MKPVFPNLVIHYHGYSRVTDWSRANPVRTHWRLYWCSDASTSVIFSGMRFPLGLTDLVLIPPHTSIDRSMEKPFDCFYIHFSLGWPFDNLCGKLYSYKLPDKMVNKLHRLVGLLGDGPSSDGQHVGISMHALVLTYLSEIPARDWPRVPHDNRVNRILKLMHSEESRLISNDALARKVGLSTNAFIRLFTQQVGTAPQAYMIKERLRKACLMLHYTDRTIEEISEACGFCDRSYFSRMFKKAFDTGPAAYRKQGTRGQVY